MLGAIARAVREMRPQPVIREDLLDRVGERLVVTGGNEQAGFAVLDQRLKAADPRADDRRAAGMASRATRPNDSLSDGTAQTSAAA